MRTVNTVKNISMSICSQLVLLLIGFLSRKVFIDSLGAEYLGVNGLLTNVLSMMVLIEGGIGISITYNLYKPLAEDDYSTITSLIQLYKKAYRILALIVLILSLLLYPFLGTLMKDGQSITNITIVYTIFVMKNIVSYLTAYKWSLINADQKGYILAKNNLIFQVISNIGKIVILILTQNYIVYLVMELLIYTVQVIWNGKIVDKRYPYIKTNKKVDLDQQVTDNINKNIKAMFLHNVGGYLVYGTDNLLISSMVSLKAVGLYSNYTMITGQLSALISPVLGGIGASVGNLIATEESHKTYDVFCVTYLINFWVYSVSCIFLYNLLEPFIQWWFGEGLLLDRLTFIFILINFYINGLRSSIGTFKSKAGLFTQDKYISVIEGIINFISSVILTKKFGLVGVFMGTTISTLTTQFWSQPRIVYKELFQQSMFNYFKKYIIYILLTLSVGGLTTLLCSFIIVNNAFLLLVIKGLICIIIPNLIYLVIYYKSKEFQYILSTFGPLLESKISKVYTYL